MTKWFDTNYHYLVPEFEPRHVVPAGLDRGRSTPSARPWPWESARGRCCWARSPSCCWARARRPARSRWHCSSGSLPVYEEVLRRLAEAGAEWVQIDEPVLALDLDAEAVAAVESAYAQLADVSAKIKICLATYFGGLRDNLAAALRLPVAAVHLDLVRAPEQLDPALELVSPQGDAVAGRDRRPEHLAGRPASGPSPCWKRPPSGSAPSGCWSALPARSCTAPSTSTRRTTATPS